MLEDPAIKKIGHNLKFDLMWMIDAYPIERGVLSNAQNLQDTMLKSQLVNRYRTFTGATKAGKKEEWQPNDLGAVIRRWLDVEIEKSIDHNVTDWTGLWSEEMISYMLEDIEYLERLNDALDAELRSQGQERAAWIESETVLGTAWMTYNGFKPDVDAWMASIKRWWNEHEHLIWHLKKLFPGVENFNSQPQLMRAMPEAIGAPLLNIKKSTIKQLKNDIHPLAVLAEERVLGTRLKNWGEHYLRKFVCTYCGRFHPEWRQIGTETSRFSCSQPNLQQIPRAKEFRRLFVAEEGYVLAALDYSAIEVLAAAVFANDRNLLAACATGDPHKATAESIVGHEVTRDSEERQNAKIANFGLLFGGGAKGLVKQAFDLFDVVLTLEEAQKIIAVYFNLYPMLRVTKNMAYRAMDEEGPVEVRNLIGFRRWLEGNNRKPTSWLNTIIQSSAGYGLKASFRYLREAGLLPFLVAQIHDELIFEFPEEDADILVPHARACMIQGMRDVLGARVPVMVDDTAVAKVWL